MSAGIETGIAVVCLAVAFVVMVIVTTKVMNAALAGMEDEPQEQDAAESACHGTVVVVGSVPRCSGCGHRQAHDGTPPCRTRSQPLRAWSEIRDRRRARRHGQAEEAS